ncbi:neuronal acetylcholine receptor subunit beta-3-like [Symsagittifera roscoffensis]|uniref:neuronal acetylcholine receptor subunit beta-3-like n=1 Tax=Symsagittifera roscoffensis TaxID=84072 RepID=UPI00307B1482
MLVLVLPCLVLYTISSLCFVLPSDATEKVSFAVTILLAEVVAFTSLSNVLPESSENTPILLYFLSAVIWHMGILCIVAVLVVNISQNGWQTWMSPRMKQFISSPYLKLIKMVPFSEQDRYRHLSIKRNSYGNVVDRLGRNVLQVTFEDNNEEKLELEKEKNDIRWRFLAIVVDRIFLLIHTVAITSNILYFTCNFAIGNVQRWLEEK